MKKLLTTVRGRFFTVGIFGGLVVLIGWMVMLWTSSYEMGLFSTRITGTGFLIGVPPTIVGIVMVCNDWGDD